METRRLLVAALASMAVLLLWQKFFPPPEPVAAPESEVVAEAPTAPATEAPPPRSARDAPATESAESAPAEVGEVAEAVPAVAAQMHEEVTLETGLARAVWSNRGAQLISYELKDHGAKDGGSVDIVRRRTGGPYPFGLTDGSGESLALNEALFVVQRSGDGATFRYSGPAGNAEKRVSLGADGLMEVSVKADGDWRLQVGPGIRNPDAEEAKSRFARRAAVYKRGDDVERIDAVGADEGELVSGTSLDWIGLQDQYFLAAVLPEAGVREVLVEPMLFELDEEGVTTFRTRPEELDDIDEETGEELRLLIEPEYDRIDLSAYFGTKRVRVLEGLPRGLDETVELGFFGILSRPLLMALNWIHDNIVSNYGWAIILLTVLLRIVLFPLNHKSIASMQKMQKLGPKQQAIRAKYRSKLKDKKGRPNSEASAKMNQEIMALYKQEGVNPAAGCLPMLMQMPVLFAFYSLLSAAVELRESPWLGWVDDLASPDPYYVLPIVMGVSMLVQQKMTPTQGDPMQRRMMMLMPIVFTFLFLGFPAGMVLYWLTNNLLAIAQQMGYKRWRAAKGEAS